MFLDAPDSARCLPGRPGGRAGWGPAAGPARQTFQTVRPFRSINFGTDLIVQRNGPALFETELIMARNGTTWNGSSPDIYIYIYIHMYYVSI